MEDYLDNKVFAGNEGSKMEPVPEDVDGFEKFIEQFKQGLSIEQEAIAKIK